MSSSASATPVMAFAQMKAGVLVAIGARNLRSTTAVEQAHASRLPSVSVRRCQLFGDEDGETTVATQCKGGEEGGIDRKDSIDRSRWSATQSEGWRQCCAHQQPITSPAMGIAVSACLSQNRSSTSPARTSAARSRIISQGREGMSVLQHLSSAHARHRDYRALQGLTANGGM